MTDGEGHGDGRDGEAHGEGEIALTLTAAHARDGEIALVRLLSLLPGHWTYRHRVSASRILLWVRAPAGGRPAPRAAVHAALRAALADPALRGWRPDGG
ncbi:hypothetical protein SUDANB171_01447 [Streptomyces sp. enrichment culture]|jgi:hypothetical protein|uniref:hypothetical protein n=1 Tax=Streptomyces xiamenensis TaxID=408015 RepID=UPI0036E05650